MPVILNSNVSRKTSQLNCLQVIRCKQGRNIGAKKLPRKKCKSFSIDVKKEEENLSKMGVQKGSKQKKLMNGQLFHLSGI